MNQFYFIQAILRMRKSFEKSILKSVPVLLGTVATIIFSASANAQAIILPVEIAEFAARKVDNQTQLSWVTHSENNTGWYVIEKSTGNGIFTAIDSVKAVGLTADYHTYTYTDKFLIEGNNHYRLKSVDIDGAISYSVVVSVQGEKTDLLLAIYPNPALQFSKATIKYETAKGTELLRVYNSTGILLCQQKLLKGTWQTHLDLRNFSKGVFYLVWQDGQTRKTEKLFID